VERSVIAVGVLLSMIGAAWAVALCLSRVRRLHRLHIRVDGARAGLDAALARRAAAAAAAGGVTACGATPGLPFPSASARPCLHPGAGTAATVPSSVGDPEAEANALSRALARLDRAALPDDVRAALADAEQLLVLARRVHNDAVRDTLGLRSRRLVRWLRLAGTAPMPAYFEIADPPAALTYDRVSPSQE
jgi:hypothetical protein